MFETDFEVVVIGGGQAGLTMGHFLGQERRRFVILERADSVAPAWRERWDSLTLFTPRRYSALPGLPIPGDPDGHSTRDEVVAYLERYAETFELPIELNSEVRRLFREGDHFVLELDGRTVTSDQVIVATGPFQTPFVPKLAAQLDPGLLQVHSTGYRRPNDVPEGTVLVVGGGNTGFQIAKELSATHKVVLSIGSKQKPLPQRIAGRDIFWWLTKTHLLSKTVESRLGSKFKGRDTLIGSSPRELTRKYKVELKGRASDGVARIVRFEDGTSLEVDSLIWATGYRPFYSWIDLPILDANGRLQHRRGVTEVPGLFFLGLTWQWTRGSALIGFVKDDAAFLAERIAALPEAETHPRPNARPKQPALRPKHPRRASEMHDHHARGHSHSGTADFPTTIEGLTEAERPEVVELSDGDDFELRIAPVTKEIGGNKVRMLAYNGSIPGPTMKVRQGSEVLVRAFNEGDLEATVHWHGLRLDNEYDGTHQTQAPIPVGGSFTYRLRFPDEGLYWYHPHIRQDYGQEMGLYGNILVEPSEPEYWPPAHRDVFLTLDDILLDDEGRVAPFSPHETDYVAMGRFGTTFLIAGEPELTMRAKHGEVVRFYLTDTANTRVFKIGVAGARMKLVGGDSGHHEQEEMVEDVILAPSERVVVDVLFDQPGQATLEHRTPERTNALAAITVEKERAEPQLDTEHGSLRINADMSAERERMAAFLEVEPDKTLAFVAEMDEIGGKGVETGVYACPMHADIVATWAGKCPKCGMKLMPAPAEAEAPTSFVCPMHPEITATWAGECPKCGMTLRATGTGVAADLGGGPPSGESAEGEHHVHGHDHSEHDEPHMHDGHGAHHEQHGHGEHAHRAADGIEWEDDMVEVNRQTTPANMRWLMIDRETGAKNHAIDWRFRVGDQIKIRLVNEEESDHPMHHPFHIHGAGRFLILSRDGVVEPNLVWKDTVLVRTNETVDILLDVSNPGLWMAHCHIAEHHESGMMFSFNVEPA